MFWSIPFFQGPVGILSSIRCLLLKANLPLDFTKDAFTAIDKCNSLQLMPCALCEHVVQILGQDQCIEPGIDLD